jgi:hypothetical protein
MTDVPFTRATLESEGFTGFQTVARLAHSRCSEVTGLPGVYAVIRPQTSAPRFRAQSVGGWFKGKDPTVPVALLRSRWVPSSDVLYIGRSQPPLRGRVDALIQYGISRPVAHQGGRYLWQIQGSNDFVVAWKADEDPMGAEVRLHEAFLRAHGTLPFANLRIG